MKIPNCIHKDRPVKSLGLCGSCYVKQHKEKNPEYKRAANERSKNWRHLNPDRQKHNYEKRKAREKASPEHFMIRRNRALKQNYGIDNDKYAEMFNDQKGLCKICSRPQGKFRLHVDHCHTTGKVRGLLCHQCNWYLGKIDKDLSLIEKIKTYLGIK